MRKAEEEMFREHHRLNGHEFQLSLENSGRQRSLAWDRTLGCNESNMNTTWLLNNITILGKLLSKERRIKQKRENFYDYRIPFPK